MALCTLLFSTNTACATMWRQYSRLGEESPRGSAQLARHLQQPLGALELRCCTPPANATESRFEPRRSGLPALAIGESLLPSCIRQAAELSLSPSVKAGPCSVTTAAAGGQQGLVRPVLI